MQVTNFDKARKISSSPFFIKTLFLASKGLNFKYLRYRVLRPILKLNYKVFNLFRPERPWTTQASIVIFEKLLTKNMVGLEYGSGRSTVFFANRLKHLTSVEHYFEWHKKVDKMLADKNITNVNYVFIPKSIDNGENDNKDEYHLSFNGNEERPEYADYSSFVLKFDDEFFDFILIDGRSRVNCGLNAMAKLKQGGMFVLDNSERTRYQPLHNALKEWPRVNTSSGLTETTIWFKP